MAQVPVAADSLKAQGNRMGNALITGDYTTFIAGMSFQSVALDSLSAFVKSGTELQATIRQHTIVKSDQGRNMATSTLIGISADNGVHWKLVNTHNIIRKEISPAPWDK